jgi:hypothetical protein
LLSVDVLTSNYREEMMAGVDVAVRFGAPESVTRTAQSYLEKLGEPRMPHDLVHHELLLFRDPQTGRPFPWEFHRDGKVIQINAAGRLMMDVPSTGVAACIAGQAVFRSLATGLKSMLSKGQLI